MSPRTRSTEAPAPSWGAAIHGRRARAGRVRLGLTALLALAGASAAPLPAGEPAPDLPRHELIFAQHSDAGREDYDLWRVCADGTQLASLVVEPGHQFQPSVSPDGTELVYAAKLEDTWEVWRRPVGRGEAVNLTNDPANDSEPAWGPTGDRLTFVSNREAEKAELYLLELESGAIRRLTDNELYDSGAAWSPDGAWVILTRFYPGDEAAGVESRGEIFRIDLESGAETRLTELRGYNGGLSVSPDGGSIAFHHTDDTGSDIWVMDADGSNPRPLTTTEVTTEYSPEWSPDGRWIAYTAGVGNDSMGTYDLWLMRADGSDARILLAGPNTQAWHVWRPGDHLCR